MLKILKTTLKSTFIYSIGNLSSKLLGIILIPLYASKLSISEYGMLGMLEVTAQIVTAVMGMSLYNAFLRWYWDKEFQKQQKAMFFTILVFVTAFSLFIIAALLPFKKQISTLLLESGEFSFLIILVFLVSALEALALIVSTLIRLQEKPGLFSALFVAKVLSSLSFTVYFIAFRGKKIDGIYEAQLIGLGVYYLMASGFVIRNIKLRLEIKVLREMLKFSYPLLLVGISGIILTISDRYILRFMSDLSSVGIYSLGFKISNTLRVFIIASVNLALHPIIFKLMDYPDSRRIYSKIMTYYAYGLMFFALGLTLFGKEAIKFLAKANPSYWHSFEIVPLLTLAIFFSMLRDVALTGINISKRTQLSARVIIIVTALDIGLNILMVPFLGYIGAAIATFIAQTLYFVMIYYYAQKCYPIPYELGKVFKILLTGIAIYFISTLTADVVLWLRLIIKSLLIISYPFLLYLFAFYEPVELQRIREFWTKWKNPIALPGNLKDFFEKTNDEI
jgi:O-antigen/teichoic acid export membrane protein